MPNGGMKPCCQLCQWATPLKEIGQVYCKVHQLTVFLAMASFCSDLSSNTQPGLAQFIAENNFETKMMYQWLEFSYPSKENPALPQYYHEPVLLAPLSEYATWGAEQAIQVSQSIHKQKREELDENDG